MKKNCEYLAFEKNATTTTTASEFNGTATEYDLFNDHSGQMDFVAVSGIAGEILISEVIDLSEVAYIDQIAATIKPNSVSTESDSDECSLGI